MKKRYQICQKFVNIRSIKVLHRQETLLNFLLKFKRGHPAPYWGTGQDALFKILILI